MTTFTLIAYRPNYNDYYGGYRQGGSDSDLTITECNSLDDIVKVTIPFYFDENKCSTSYDYADWELILLIDGKKESWDEDDEDYSKHAELREVYDDKLKEAIEAKKQIIIEERRIAEEERKRLEIESNIRAKKYQQEQDLLLYKRLKQKYEPNS